MDHPSTGTATVPSGARSVFAHDVLCGGTVATGVPVYTVRKVG